MPVPKNLNYDMWLGSTPVVPYTEKRVHPQTGYDRPGWLRCEQFGAGMITGWGAHHIDSAHWGMDTEYTGPVEIWGTRRIPEERIVGRSRSVPDRSAVRQRRAHDRQRRFSERHPVRRDRRVDFRVARQRDGDRQRSGRETAGQPGARGERSEDHQVGDRPRRDSPATTARIITATGSRASARASSRSRRSKWRIARAPPACCITWR